MDGWGWRRGQADPDFHKHTNGRETLTLVSEDPSLHFPADFQPLIRFLSPASLVSAQCITSQDLTSPLHALPLLQHGAHSHGPKCLLQTESHQPEKDLVMTFLSSNKVVWVP